MPRRRRQRDRSGPRPAAVVCLLALAASSAGCRYSVRLAAPITGRIVDAETQRPIAGAALTLSRVIDCGGRTPDGSDSWYYSLVETTTGATGRFWIASLAGRMPCAVWRRHEELNIVAPGYLPTVAIDADEVSPSARSVRAGSFSLRPIRYRSELDFLRRPADVPARNGLALPRTGPVWVGALAAARERPPRPAGPLGVFASRSAAAFERVTTASYSTIPDVARRPWVVAQNGLTGAFYAWTPRGDPSPLPMPGEAGLSLVGGRREEPALLANGRVYLPATGGSLADLGPDRWVPQPPPAERTVGAATLGTFMATLEAGRREVALYDLDAAHAGQTPGGRRGITLKGRFGVSDLFGSAAPPDCVTRIGGTAPDSAFVFIQRARSQSQVYLLRGVGDGPLVLKVHRVRLQGSLPSPVTACDGGQSGVYVALADSSLVRIDIRLREKTAEGEEWVAEVTHTLAGPSWGAPQPVRSLAVGQLKGDRGEEALEVLYAVLGDGRVYRFTADLRPDQRLEALPPGGP